MFALWLASNSSFVARGELIYPSLRMHLRCLAVTPTAKRQYSVRNMDALMTEVFGSCLSLPPLVGGGGGLICKSVPKDDRL